MNTSQKGNVAVAKVLARLVELGFTVLQPFGDCERYDLVTETDGKFQRIQVKMGKLKEGVIVATLQSRNEYSGTQYYEGEVDQFAIYCPGTDGTYMIDAADVKSSIQMRLEPPKNNQHKNIKWAETYRI